jgi:CheY-like chemotaxis protein
MKRPISRVSILLVEDDEAKRNSVMAHLLQIGVHQINVTHAISLNEAICQIDERIFDLAIVDLSLPTYGAMRCVPESGLPQGFGGVDVLRFLKCEHPTTVSVGLTQYAAFEAATTSKSITIPELDSLLRNELGETFAGIVYYYGRDGDWKNSIRSVVLKVTLESGCDI